MDTTEALLHTVRDTFEQMYATKIDNTYNRWEYVLDLIIHSGVVMAWWKRTEDSQSHSMYFQLYRRYIECLIIKVDMIFCNVVFATAQVDGV
jgi:hypothetical protein